MRRWSRLEIPWNPDRLRTPRAQRTLSQFAQAANDERGAPPQPSAPGMVHGVGGRRPVPPPVPGDHIIELAIAIAVRTMPAAMASPKTNRVFN